MKKKIIYVFLILLVLPSCFAAEDYVFRKGEAFDFKIACEDGGYYCSSNTECNFTLIYSNGTSPIDNQYMTYKTSYFNYTVAATENIALGTHKYIVMCADYTAGINGTSTGNILITARGKESTVADALLYIGALALLTVFLVMCIIAFRKTNKPQYKLLSFYGGYLLLVAISYIVWLTSENIIMTTQFLSKMFYWTFIFLLFAFTPIFFAGIIWLIWLSITIKPLRDMIEHGLPEGRISERIPERKGRKRKW